ncbi:MAG: type IV-A pilus assembly ATPase PilB [Myxococcota bacterium]|nr:type IV-A pilus assembly ATPase PilB [Myxococcota bacterium]MEE2780301.1 type IV-A pilus assembly ATPase PilB [Myxococcota bacterium]
MLVRQGLVSQEQIEDAKDQTKQQGGGLTGALAKLGYVKETQLVEFLSRQYGVPSINLEEVEVDEEVIELVPREVAERHQVIPIEKQGQTLIVALTDPSNIYAMDDIKFLTGFNVEVVVTSEASIESALEQYYAPGGEFEEALEGYDEDEIDFLTGDQGVEDFENLEDEAEEAPVVRLVNVVLVDAIKRNCSDIHIEPYEKEFRIRYRIDGVLYNIMNPPMRLKNAITSRLKIMSELDIAERRLPQDGRIKLVLGGGKEVDFRVSVLPTLFGEKVVLRILDKSNLQLDMTKLGFEPHQLETFLHAVHQPFGMVLVTGPTGSGKTTTLYSALQDLNKISENISTAEDPVEFNMTGINQCQMKDDIGLNFAAALRSFLRQDPDIIMVGEIRDFETGEIAIKAALTGHLVLSTLHTNDAPSTINRMLNMGIEPFMITSSLNSIVAQRLARRVHADCAEPLEIDEATLKDLGVTDEQIKTATFMKGAGCSVCNGTGFKGRVALYEVMSAGDEIKEAVLGGYSSMELKKLAIECGMQTLRMSGNKKLCEGVTSVSEVLRVTRSDDG